MVSNLKGTASGEAGSEVQAIMNDIASLRSDIAALTAHLGSTAKNATSSAADQIGAQASKTLDGISAQGQRSAKAIGQQVEEQPLLALLIAFALGFVGSRLVSR